MNRNDRQVLLPRSAASRHRGLSAHDRAAVCGTGKICSALEDVMQDDKQILLVTQKNAADDDPASDGYLYDWTACYCVAIAETAGRHGQGVGGGRAARPSFGYSENP